MLRIADFTHVAWAYLCALILALGVAKAFPSATHPLVVFAAMDAAATGVLFLFSILHDNSSVYDPYWSVAPIAAAAYFSSGARDASHFLIFGLIVLYGARLTWNWARGWGGLAHEDWRYRDLRTQSRAGYWLVSLLGIHGFPTLLVYLGVIPLYWALGASGSGFSALGLLAAMVTFGSILLEGVADEQLRAFRRTAAPGSTCEQGVWAWSRHPNYLGEIGFWLGLALFGWSVRAPFWSGGGVLAMVGLFVFISIPLSEAHSLARRPGFAALRSRVPALLPRRPKREAPPRSDR